MRLNEKQLKIFDFVTCLIVLIMYAITIILMDYIINSIAPFIIAIIYCFMINWLNYKNTIRMVDSETGFILWRKV